MRMAERLARLFTGVRATGAIGRGDAAKAVHLLESLERDGALSSVQGAELATALLRSGQPRRAQQRFASLQKQAGDRPEQRYVQKYCRYYLALIRDERSQADYEWRLAQSTPSSRWIRKRLPMPRVAEKASPGVEASLSLR